MPKNTVIPQEDAAGLPPVPEQSLRLNRGRGTALRGYTPSTNESDRWVMSWWQKTTSALTLQRTVWEARVDANNYTRFQITLTGQFRFEAWVAGVLEAVFTSERFMFDSSDWHHCHLRFDRLGGFLQFSINGYGYPSIQQVPFSSISNIPGYVWMNTTAEHFIGNDSTLTTGISALVAEMHCVPLVSLPPVTDFGQFNSNGVWEPIPYVGGHGASGFYLPFSRTLDLGEDFSGNANDFTIHAGAAPLGADQFDDYIERNYCVLNERDPDSSGLIDEGGLDVAGGSARVTMRPETGVWYYEFNGTGFVHDTGVSGQFNPLLGAGSYNFGQLPFQDVGPGIGEDTLNSQNLPTVLTLNQRDWMSSVQYAGNNAIDPRTILAGEGQSTIYDIEYNTILHICDLVIAKTAGPPGTHWYLAQRLRNGFQVTVSSTAAEEATNLNGYISDLLDPGPGVEVTRGGTNGANVNENGSVHSLLAFRIEQYGINVQINNDDDDAEEDVSGGIPGPVDNGSSDLELVLEGGSTEQQIGLRFNNLLIPQGAEILEARMQFEVDATSANTPSDMLIFCEDVDNAATFVNVAGNISGRPRVGSGVAWSPAHWVAISDRLPAQRTTSFGSELQGVVNRGGWAPGNSAVVLIEGDPGGTLGEREAEAHDSTTPADRNPTELQVRYKRTPSITTNLMSVFTYEGIGKARDVMHGNGQAPDLIALKNLGGNDWVVYCSAIQSAGAPENGRLSFNNTNAFTLSSDWDNTAPGGTFFRVGTPNRVNERGQLFSGFTFVNQDGFSRAFRYVGNGNVDGPFVYLGFKPRFLVLKRTQNAGNWITMHKSTDIIAKQNNQFNTMESMGFLNTTTNFFQPGPDLQAYANGFKIVDTDVDVNGAAEEYIGFAFAEASFKQNKATN